MVSINWCLKQKKGISLIEPNLNMSKSYIEMSKNALGTMNREKKLNQIFSISAAYYAMYYSLFALLMKLGIKSEIHKCTIKIMESLSEFYNKEDIKNMNNAFDLRNNTQYYVDKIIDQRLVSNLYNSAPLFVAKTKNIIISLNEVKINEIRNRIKNNEKF